MMSFYIKYTTAIEERAQSLLSKKKRKKSTRWWKIPIIKEFSSVPIGGPRNPSIPFFVSPFLI